MYTELEELVAALANAADETVTMCVVGDTCMLEAESFELSCVIGEAYVEIRNIETRKKGIGSSILFTIHEYCDEHCLGVCASCVKLSAVGFWYKMGYIEGDRGEFFRCA